MNQVTVHNIEIPFWRLVSIILKFMLASIPAVILLYIILALCSIVFFLLFGGIIGGFGLLDSLDTLGTQSSPPEFNLPGLESSEEPAPVQ
ncbi:MAG: hypothetical protein P1U85_22050 [Verrucomicrobiales bacterium]|jgi:hypothetical protein|nr:hypothetical protein [Verrucomicrobiales bacterium]